MADTTELTWTYSPADYFESPTRVSLPNGELSIGNGTATYIGSGVTRADRKSALATADAQLRTVFDSRRLITNQQYQLGPPGFVEIGPGGRRSTVFFAEARFVENTSASADFTIIDQAGNVVADSKAERIASDQAYVADLVEKTARSSVLRRMIASYAESQDDPSNALVHLYEVRDAAAKYLGTDARAALKISKADWNLLGDLANNEPIVEGRHRGRATGPLRNATAEELSRARVVAKRILDAFAGTI